MLLLAVALAVPTAGVVAPAAATLGAAYATTLVGAGRAIDREAPLVAVVLLLVCELGYWAHELRTTAPDQPGRHGRHVAWLGVLGIGAFLPGVALLALGDLLRVKGIAIEVIGVLAVGALVLGLVLLVRSPERS